MANMDYSYDQGGHIFEGDFAYANSAADETVVALDVAVPATGGLAATYRAFIYNPGAVAITVRYYNGETLNGTARYAELDATTVTAATTATDLITGFAQSGLARVTVENDDVVGGSGAFTATVKLRQVS